MGELFRLEVENQSVVFTENLLALEQNPTDASRLETLMRGAHSLKGAARMVDRDTAVAVAHELEDVFVAAQTGALILLPPHIDVLLRGVDLLNRIAQTPDDKVAMEKSARREEVDQFLRDLNLVRLGKISPAPAAVAKSRFLEDEAPVDLRPEIVLAEPIVAAASQNGDDTKRKHQRFLRVTPENLNRLLALTGETLVESRRLAPFLESLLSLKRQHHELARILDRVRESLSHDKSTEHAEAQVAQARAQLARCR